MPAPRAVILDFNGTLSDDEPLLCRLFQSALSVEAGVELATEDYFGKFAGLSDPEIAEASLRAAGADPSRDLLDRVLRAKIDGYVDAVDEEPPINHAAIEFVETIAARLPLAIASGAWREEIEHVLDLTGIRDRFDAVVCIDDVEAGKPDPSGYLLALERLNEANGSEVGAAEVTAFEDSAAGVSAAHDAGMRCGAIAGNPRAAAVADFTVDRLEASVAEALLRGD